METVIVVIVIATLLVVSSKYAQLSKIAGYRYRISTVEAVDNDNFSIASLLTKASTPILDIGFEPVGYLRQRSLESMETCELPMAVFWHEEQATFAWLRPALPAEPDSPIDVIFMSCFDDDRFLCTVNPGNDINPVDGIWLDTQAAPSKELGEKWGYHLKRVAAYESESNQRRQAQSLVELIGSYNTAIEKDFFESHRKKEVLGEPNDFFISFATAKKYARGAARKFKASQNSEPSDDNNEVTSEPDAFARLLNNEDILQLQAVNLRIARLYEKNGSQRKLVNIVSFILGLAAFSIFFGLWLGWALVPVLIAVLLFHELGHYLAMRAFGFTQTKIFFVPGLGAAASGHGEHASYWQRFIIYLAGPMPGIVLGIVLLAVLPLEERSVIVALTILIVVNAFNLLPFMPFDGGKVVDLSLGETSSFWFVGLSALGLLTLAYYIREPILWVIGGFMVISCWGGKRLLSLRKELESLRLKKQDEDEFVLHGLRVIENSEHSRMPILERIGVLSSFLQKLGMPKVTTSQTVFGLTIYLACWVIPAVALFHVFNSIKN